MTSIAIVIVGGGIIFCLVGIGLSIDRVAKSLEQIARMMKGYWDSVDDMAEYIRKQLTTDVAEVKHGHWIRTGAYVCGEYEFECSICKNKNWHTSDANAKFCQYCGARMDGKDGE